MRIIDADALVRDHGFFIEDEDGFPTCVVCETDIRYYPTIDAVPVVREKGEWLHSKRVAFAQECSVCGGVVHWDECGCRHDYDF